MGITKGNHRRGRPPKFEGNRRPVTVTLPERTLRSLSAIDADRARAIVRAAERCADDKVARPNMIEKVNVGSKEAVILVADSRPLRSIPWLRLGKVGPGRFLMALASGTTIEQFELQIRDLLAERRTNGKHDRKFLEELLGLISNPRKRRAVSKAEILFIPSEA